MGRKKDAYWVTVREASEQLPLGECEIRKLYETDKEFPAKITDQLRVHIPSAKTWINGKRGYYRPANDLLWSYLSEAKKNGSITYCEYLELRNQLRNAKTVFEVLDIQNRFKLIQKRINKVRASTGMRELLRQLEVTYDQILDVYLVLIKRGDKEGGRRVVKAANELYRVLQSFNHTIYKNLQHASTKKIGWYKSNNSISLNTANGLTIEQLETVLEMKKFQEESPEIFEGFVKMSETDLWDKLKSVVHKYENEDEDTIINKLKETMRIWETENNRSIKSFVPTRCPNISHH